MLDPKEFLSDLRTAGFDFFTGVPDSLLKDFCACVSDNTDGKGDLIAANEGAAIALAAGHHLATGRYGLVYMQNSGLGNAVNPLTSLADTEVYSIPMLLLIGWRGEPGRPDEPQHVKQGKITQQLLECLGIPHALLPSEAKEVRALLSRIRHHLEDNGSPFAIVVSAGTFENYALKSTPARFEMSREDVIRNIASVLDDADIIVSTTGKASRELFEYRASTGGRHAGDFLTVGSMGHASQIALSIAAARPERQVFCLDGDGAAIMHLGSFAIAGTRGPENFKHIVINNGAHDSVGGQPTAGHEIDFAAIASACRYRQTERIEHAKDLVDAVMRLRKKAGPAFLEVLANKGARVDLGRPTMRPMDNKIGFMRNLSG